MPEEEDEEKSESVQSLETGIGLRREATNEGKRKKERRVSECRVTWVEHRCGASRLTSVLNSTKILNDASL